MTTHTKPKAKKKCNGFFENKKSNSKPRPTCKFCGRKVALNNGICLSCSATTPKPNGWEERDLMVKRLAEFIVQYKFPPSGWTELINDEWAMKRLVEIVDQAILSAEEKAIRDLIASVGYRVETVLGYLEMGKTEEAIKHLENIHELFVTKPK